MDKQQDKFRGCLIGGAVGDALGYAVEFKQELEIFNKYGKDGIHDYNLVWGYAIVSDDTQMTLFTAEGLLNKTAEQDYTASIRNAYLAWLETQFGDYPTTISKSNPIYNELLEVPNLFRMRAPGGTCLTSLSYLKEGRDKEAENQSKGCGGVMRVAPIGLYTRIADEERDVLGEKAANITHGHPLGCIPAAAVVHIVHDLAYTDCTIAEAVTDALEAMEKLYCDSPYISKFVELMENAVDLAKSDTPVLDAIHMLGEGWVAEETLAIAVYCALRFPNDFEKAICAAVNHNGDSDSTGAVCGNIMGAALGYEKIPKKYLEDLEMHDLIVGIADKLLDK